MKSIRRMSRALFIILVMLHPACSQTQPQPRVQPPRVTLAIRAARMLDVRRGELVSDAVVIVEGDRITAAGSRLDIPAGARVIELGDATLVPGLIDAHTHITYHFDETGHFGLRGDASADVTLRYAAENARRTLEAGFTTIRNLGAGGGVDLRLRDAIRRGELVGPRIVASGEPLTPNEVYGETDAATRLSIIRRFVAARVTEGADVIKIFEGIDGAGKPYFNREEIRAAVEAAARGGLKVAVHAHEAATIKAAVEGGCASVEHGTYLDAIAIQLLVAHRTALVPTLYLPTHYLAHKDQFAFDASTWDFFAELKSRNFGNLRAARKAGVLVVAGSDAVAGLHGENAREIVWLTKAGMTPAEALRAATLDAAELLGLTGQVGEVRAGAFADLIAVGGDPLRDIETLERVSFVMKSGEVIKGAKP